MEPPSSARVIQKVRRKIEVSQEGLARMLNATKGAVQHWERGRNSPDMGRLIVLRQLCPPGTEKKELEALIKQTQSRFAPLARAKVVEAVKPADSAAPGPAPAPGGSYAYLRRENHRLQRQVARLEGLVQRRAEQLRILEALAAEQQRDMAKLRGGKQATPNPAANPNHAVKK